MLRAITDPLLSLVYPQECRVCSGLVEHHSDGVACEACWQETKIFTGSEMLCSKCGAFFSDKAAPVAVRCHKCDDHHYDNAVALGVYEKALSASILSLKTTPNLSEKLASIIREHSPAISEGCDTIIPVPLAKLRRVERGFNQAEVIAAAVSKATGIEVDAGSLARKRHTPVHRIGMDQRARELTVEKAFEVSRPKLVEGRHVLLVDDVLTSGSTASACAKVLRRSGAAGVKVFTLARAVMR